MVGRKRGRKEGRKTAGNEVEVDRSSGGKRKKQKRSRSR